MSKNLYDLSVGEKRIIKKVEAARTIKERLHSFGLIRGVEITPVGRAPLGCPRIYNCLNSQVSIRNNIAKQIQIYEE